MAIVRAIAAIVVGYIAMFLLLFLLFTAAYLAMGADRAFKPASYDPSTLWLVVSFAAGLVAAVTGGLVAALIAPAGSKAPIILAAVVLVIGLIFAIPVITAAPPAEPEVRSGDVGNLDAMMKGRQPVSAALINPFIGVVGVLLGARLRRRGAAPAP